MYSKIIIDKKIDITNVFGFGLSGEHNFFRSIKNDENDVLNMVVCGVCRDYNDVMKSSFVDIGFDKLALLKNVKLDIGEKIVVQVKKLPHGDKGCIVSDKIIFHGEYFDLEYNGQKNIVDRSFGSGVEKKQAEEFISIIGEQYLGVTLKKNAITIKPLKLMEIIGHTYEKLNELIVKEHSGKEILMSPVNEVEKFLWKVDPETTIETNCGDLYNNINSLERNVSLVKSFSIDVDTIFKDLLSTTIVLPNGGEILIETLETLTFIDVNSTGQSNSKDNSSHKVNISAAKEIAKILTFGGIGGTIMIDFIRQKNRSLANELLVVLKSAFKKLNAGQVDVLGYSKSGLVEITKKRSGNSIFDKYITKLRSDYTNEYYMHCLLNDCVDKHVNGKNCYVYCNEDIAKLIKNSDLLDKVVQIIKMDVIIEVSDKNMVVYKSD